MELRELFLLIVPGPLISKSFLRLFVRNGRIYGLLDKWQYGRRVMLEAYSVQMLIEANWIEW